MQQREYDIQSPIWADAGSREIVTLVAYIVNILRKKQLYQTCEL